MRLRSLLAVFATLLLVACGSLPPLYERHTVEYQEDAATTFVTAYPAIPWDEVKDKFDPGFTMTADAALALAGLPTQALVGQGLATSSVGLAVNFAGPPPAASGSSGGTTTATGGTGTSGSTSGTAAPKSDSTSTATSTVASKVPGSVPTSPAATPGYAGSDVSPSVSDAIAGKLALIDSSLRVDAALGLNQKIQRINNTIGKAYLPKGYRAHIVTLQVGMQPLSRNLPYDTYINISLLPGSVKGDLAYDPAYALNELELPPIVILPVLIIDNIESAIISTTLERIKEAGISLGGGIKSAGARIDAKGGTDFGQSALGYDKNSLMTIGRVNETTVVVRLGAAQQGSYKYSMIPRTHDFSLLVLVRESMSSLSVVTRSVLRDAETGQQLKSKRDRIELRNTVVQELTAYGYSINSSCDALASVRKLASDQTSLDAAKFDEPLDLLRFLDTGNLPAFAQCIGLSTRKVELYEEPRLRRLIAELNGILVGSRYAKMMIPLKPAPRPALPSESTIALAYDDGESMQVRVPGGVDLASDKLRGTLQIIVNGTSVELSSTATSVGDKGSDLIFGFPSLQKLKLAAPKDGTKSFTVRCATCQEKLRPFNAVYVKTEKEQQETPFSVSSSVLVADDAGSGTLSISVKKLPAGKNLSLVVEGADLRAVTSGSAVSLSEKGAKLSKQGLAVIQVANATPEKEIQLSAFDDDEKHVYGKSTSLRVEQARHATH
jgi:hypothetical protein